MVITTIHTHNELPSSKPSNNDLLPRQLASLKGIVDGLLPPIEAITLENDTKPQNIDENGKRYWEYCLSEDLHFMHALQDSIQYKLRTKQEQVLLFLVLYLMSTRLGTLLVFGPVYFIQFPFVAFCDLPLVTDKTRVLKQHLQQSILSPKRRLFNAFKRLIFGLAFSFVTTPTNDDHDPSDARTSGTNPFWKAMQYCGTPQLLNRTDDSLPIGARLDESPRVKQAMAKVEALNKHLLTTSTDSNTPTTTTNPTPLVDTTTIPCQELQCDFVIVGSGCGGSVAAFELSKAGYDVIVVEQGEYIPPSCLTSLEVHAMDKLYDSHALLTTEDGNLVILAGATLGGGSSVNWSCCLPLPPHVQHEWVTEHGLERFKKGGEFDASLKHMMALMTNNENGRPVQHNAMNKILQMGCESLGYHWATTGQNLEDTADPAAGYIGFGDKFGNKRSALNTFLNPAVGQYGARVLEQCYVEKVLRQQVDSKNTPNQNPASSRPYRAVGVSCRMRNSSATVTVNDEIRVEIRSRKGVVVAAGALHSPCILLRSGFRNRHIGRNLRLHPVTVAIGRFEQIVDFYLGAPMTTVCNEFEMGPSRNGYGCKIECPSAHPGLTAVAIPFTTPEQVKERMLNFSRIVPLVVLQRDGGKGGRVRCHPEHGRPMIDYSVNASDQQSILEGVKGMVQLLAAAGAREIATCHYKDTGWKASLDKESGPTLSTYLESISRRGMGLHDFGVFSAHQMGTCRLSSNPSHGVIDPNGESWECSDLYVMDASTFPTASGANPMMTVLSISHMLSTRLVTKIGLEGDVTSSNSGREHLKKE